MRFDGRVTRLGLPLFLAQRYKQSMRVRHVAALALTGWCLMVPASHAEATVLAFERYSADRLHGAQAEGQPVVLMFDANWCPPCRVMEQTTFRDPKVLAAAAHFVLLEADLSMNGIIADNLRRRFDIKGTPTFMFFDSRGQLVSKFLGGMDADDFLKQLGMAAD